MTTETPDMSPQIMKRPFGEDIERLTEDSVGRDWVYAEVEAWLRN